MLFVPGGGNQFGAIQSNNSGQPTAPQGTSLTPVVGSKGSWAQAIASLTNDTYGLLICINGNNVSAGSRNSVVDIGIGASGSEVVLIPDLIAGNAVNYNVGGGGLWYFFPVALPAGTRIAVRGQGSVTTAFSVFVQALQNPASPALVKQAGVVEVIGMSLPQGTAVTAGTGSEGAWTLLGATVNECWHWQLGVQVTSGDTTHGANVYHIDLAEGDGTNFSLLMESVPFVTNTTEGGAMPVYPLACERRVPSGRNIYARAQASGAVDSLFIAAYGAGG